MKTNKRKQKYIIGHPTIVQTLPNHPLVPFTREVYFGAEAVNVDDLHIAVHHIINAENVTHDYAKPHKHDVQELNILIGLERDKPLKYRFTLGKDSMIIESPASIVIPAGTEHTAIAVEGNGLFLCIIRKGKLQ